MSSNYKKMTTARQRSGFPPLEKVFSGKRILLTGATGFLGKTFLYLLLRDHPEFERVYLLVRGDERSSARRVQREIIDSPAMAPLRERLGERFESFVKAKLAVVPGDITEPGLFLGGGSRLGRGDVDAVVNCAGLVNFDAPLNKALAVNTLGVDHVIEFCKRTRASLLHVSTCYVAGAADGNRYEDDAAVDWCPSPDGRRFNLKREIREACALVAHIEASALEETDGTTSEWDDESDDAPARSRKQLAEEELKRQGRERALSWGWPNTYSYSKSLGEQLVLAARPALKATVVRPAVIESAIRDPFPGWNQGINTSAPLTYLSGEGYRFYPARRDLILDVIPVDLVAHAMFPILAALLLGRAEPVYQLGSSDRNPLRMERLIELTALANRRIAREGDDAKSKLLTQHFEPIPVSQQTFEIAVRALPQGAKQIAKAAELILGKNAPVTRQLERWADEIGDRIALGRSLIDIYRPYIQQSSYIFHTRNIRELYRRLNPADALTHRFDPENIDWHDYWVNVHIPGLRRHIFPRLDLATRNRPRAPLRYKNLVELVEESALRYGSKPALSLRQPGGELVTLSYRELRDMAHRAALMLATRGVKPGDRVLLSGENCPEWIIAFFAIVIAGAVAVPLDPALSVEEVRSICRIAEPVAAICSTSVRQRWGKLENICGGGVWELNFEDLRKPFILHSKPAAGPSPGKDTLASIVFTSGTTGTPKGVMLTHGNFTSQVSMLSRIFELDTTDTVLSLLPLHHCFEFTCGMLLPLASGAHIVYPRNASASTLGIILASVKPTALIGVPALWQAIHRRILEQVEKRGPLFKAAFNRLRDFNHALERDFGFGAGSVLFRPLHEALGGRLRLAVSGGAALPAETAEFFNDIGIRLLEGYGLTEAAPVLSVARPDEPLKIGSVGKPLPGIEIKIDSADGSETGEIIARGPNVMAGYFRNPEATKEVLRDGWLRTGDLGRFDSEGLLYIVGRCKEVIVDAGGNNIYIDELEELYGRSPDIKELAIVGLKIGAGEQPAALIVPAYEKAEARRAIEERIRRHFERVSAGLAHFKQVKIIRFTDRDLPRTRTRKIRRSEVVAQLRAMVADGQADEAAPPTSELEGWLATALEQISGGKVQVSSSSRLIEDLGLDSLALAELVEIIEEHAGTSLTPEQLSGISTAGELQELIARRLSAPPLPSYAALAEPYTLKLPRAIRRMGQSMLGGSLEALVQRWLAPRVVGRGNIPANRNFLVVANHASHLDFILVRLALGKIGERLVVLAAKDYFFGDSLRRFVAANFTQLLPFDREKVQLESLQAALEKLRQGANVLMFPEGTRSLTGAIQEFKSGAGFLALRSGCDVLPVCIVGTHQALGKGQLIPRRSPVEVRIGPVITNSALARAARDGEGYGAYRRAAEVMRQRIIELAQVNYRRAGSPRDEKESSSVLLETSEPASN